MDPLTLGLTLASKFAPDIIRYFTKSDTAADVALKVVDIAKTVTGKDTGDEAMAVLSQDPAMALQFKMAVLASQTDLEKAHLADRQAEHSATQATIQSGDNAADEYVRHTRPRMARQSWYAGVGYLLLFEGMKLFSRGEGASIEIAIVLLSPAFTYLGLRTWDKRSERLFGKKAK